MPLHTRAAHTSSASLSSSQPQNQQTAFSFCIKLIERPESTSRRHKLVLAKQSVRSEEDKTRFTCVHRSMTTGHSQNTWRKIPDDAELHIRAPEIDLRCKYSNTQVRLTAEFKPVTFSDLEYTLNIHNPKIVFNKWKKSKSTPIL